MKNINKIFSIYLTSFQTDYSIKRILDSNFVLKESDILESIQKTERMCNTIPNFILEKREKEFLINKIKSLYAVHQDEGYVILGDYEADYEWYERLLSTNGFEQYYWERYKNYLLNIKNFSPNVVETLEYKTLNKVMSYLGDPNVENVKFSVRGLVVGDVQSGKTSNYLGLLSKAADAGYKVFFILTGTVESLRKQTQIRVEEGFIGYDSVNGKDVGVGRGKKLPKAFTSRAKDFTSGDNQNTTYKISDYSSEPMIFVVKKNVSVLKKIYSSLKLINTSSENEKIDFPMLMIDDEADNASINTNKEDNDPTQVNKYIRNILSLFTRNSYVGFTATPFANVFIGYDSDDEMLQDDLFPRDFIYALKTPSNYCGAEKYFINENSSVRLIKDFEDEILPLNHKKGFQVKKLFKSCYHAINTFLLANAIRDIRDIKKETHRSMLINMSRFTDVQLEIKEIVEEYIDIIKISVKQCRALLSDYALTNPYIKSLKESFDKEYNNIKYGDKLICWEDVFNNLYDSISKIKVVVVNSSKNSEKLDYESKDGLRVIAIGGLALSRGLTLEGLCVSYFYRNTSTFDVLMQMGRWFGYRDGYEELCKIFLPENSLNYYKDIWVSIECLKEDINKMGKAHKKPEEYGIRVRNDSNELNITASNKMRNTQRKIVYNEAFYGNVFETPYLYRDLSKVEENKINTINFINNVCSGKKNNRVLHPYYENISKYDVIDLLDKLKIHPANERFDIKQINHFFKNVINKEYVDILILGGASSKKIILEKADVDINLISREYDVKGQLNDIIRLNKNRAHLWGPSDTRFGLNDDEIKKITPPIRAQSYMIHSRNPLLIIYFIDPCNHKDGESIPWEAYEMKLKEDLKECAYNCLIGYAIGFPAKEENKFENANSVPIRYTVNKSVNYFEKDHNFEEEIDE